MWKRSNQQALVYTLIGGEIAGALWEGGETRLGKTFWQAIDSSALGGVSYIATARVKAQAHWQTDVLAIFALGTLTGYLAHSRDNPVILSVLPHGFTVGLRAQF